MDIMFVNNLPFLITASRNLKAGTAQFMVKRTQESIYSGLQLVIKAYNRRGFNVKMILADPEFECHRQALEDDHNIDLNIASAGEHVPEIERYIRTVKERIRAQWSRLPYRAKMPRLITIELVKQSVAWLNSFPPKGGVSETLSPRVIMTGIKMDCKKHCRMPFGDCAQAYEKTDNNNSERTVGAICLGPSYNLQGGYNFMKLSSGKLIHRNQFYPCPITQDVIERVLEIGEIQKGPRGLQFKNKQREILEHCIDNDNDIAGVNPSNITGVNDNNQNDDITMKQLTKI